MKYGTFGRFGGAEKFWKTGRLETFGGARKFVVPEKCRKNGTLEQKSGVPEKSGYLGSR